MRANELSWSNIARFHPVALLLSLSLLFTGLTTMMPSAIAAENLKSPYGQFLDKDEILIKLRELMKGGIPGSEKPTSAEETANRLVDFIFSEVKDSRGIHIETALTALGSLAGFSVQMAIREELMKRANISEKSAFTIVVTKDGGKYYFGDLLNEGLAEPKKGNLSVWSFVGGAAQKLGAKQLPDLDSIFGHVSKTVGSNSFGVPRLPAQHMPNQLPIVLLNKFWNPTRNALVTSVKSPGQWPFAIGLAAQYAIIKGKDVIDPALAAQIVMEAAVPMSKVDPSTVRSGYFYK